MFPVQSCVVDTTAVNDTTAADGTDTNDDPLPATEYDASSLADDIADESDLGLLREALILPKDGWTTDNPRLRLPRVLRTNITRYAFHTVRTFVLALCCLYDESSLYTLR